MKVEAVTLHFKPGVTSLGGWQFISFSEGKGYQDLHYITREGQHVVNYSDPVTGKRHGIGFPMTDIRQTNTIL
ncbi:hypothetical protein [Salmonella phage vB_SenAt-pSL2]|nr:hypothetical protein [Salmonella phage vB_SenAt-pSL2]HBL6576726.1 hypothetical protein [Salmonella enterica subsp. enterica serovar Typhimurium]